MPLSNLNKEELASYLKGNKASLIAEKKADIKFTSSLVHKPKVIAKREVKAKTEETKDSSSSTDPTPAALTTLDVKVVCNAAWFCDSHMDVITANAYKSSVEANAISLTIPHIADHKQTSTSHVGDVTAFYTEVMPLKELGLDQAGETTALIMETTIRQDYNPDVFKFYQNGKIDQHSIGLRYNSLDIAINNATEDYTEEKALWDEYYPQVINKELVDLKGYFFVINDMTVVENSCVLFGANSLTPTLSIKSALEIVEEVEEVKVVKEEVLIPKEEVLTLSTKPKGIIMTTEEKYIALMAEHDTLKASVALDVGKAIQTERQRCVKGIEAAKTFGISETTVIKALTKGYSLDTMNDMFTDLAEAKGEQTSIKTSAGSLGSADADAIEAIKASGKEVSMEDNIMKGFEELGKDKNLFAGIR